MVVIRVECSCILVFVVVWVFVVFEVVISRFCSNVVSSS